MPTQYIVHLTGEGIAQLITDLQLPDAYQPNKGDLIKFGQATYQVMGYVKIQPVGLPSTISISVRQIDDTP